jgi:hypothetical protein
VLHYVYWYFVTVVSKNCSALFLHGQALNLHILDLLDTEDEGKVHPRTGHEGAGGGVDVQLYSSLNLGAKMGVGGQRYAPAALPPRGKTRYPLYRVGEKSPYTQKIRTSDSF